MNECFRKITNKIVENSLIRITLENLEPIDVDLKGWDRDIPVFIIGLPRSGTTLIYQLLTNKYNFSYII